MRAFFKPWRRKIGVLTLGLACVFAGLWIRGITIQDSLWFGFAIHDSSFSTQVQKTVTHGMVLDTLSSSAKEGVVWGRWTSGEGNLAWVPGWKTHSTDNNDLLDPFEPLGNPLNPALVDYRWNLLGVEIAQYHVWNGKADIYSFWRLSHLSIVVPLTLISAGLLLITPRSAKQAKTIEQTSAMAA